MKLSGYGRAGQWAEILLQAGTFPSHLLFFGSLTPQIHSSITTTSASEGLKAGHCRCLLGLKAQAALHLCKDEQNDSENISPSLSKKMLPSHSPCTAEKQTHLSQEQRTRRANLARVTACLQGKYSCAGALRDPSGCLSSPSLTAELPMHCSLQVLT